MKRLIWLALILPVTGWTQSGWQSEVNRLDAEQAVQDGRLDTLDAEQVIQHGRLDGLDAGQLVQDGRLDANEQAIASLEDEVFNAPPPVTAPPQVVVTDENGDVIGSLYPNTLDAEAGYVILKEGVYGYPRQTGTSWPNNILPDISPAQQVNRTIFKIDHCGFAATAISFPSGAWLDWPFTQFHLFLVGAPPQTPKLYRLVQPLQLIPAAIGNRVEIDGTCTPTSVAVEGYAVELVTLPYLEYNLEIR